MKLKVQIGNMSSEFLTMLDLSHSQQWFQISKKIGDLNRLASEKERCWKDCADAQV